MHSEQEADHQSKADSSHVLAKIAHISDLHIGECFDEGLGEHLAWRLEEYKPDAIVVSGDAVNNPVWWSVVRARRFLIELRERCGTNPKIIFVPGNHDAKLFGILKVPRTELVYRILRGEFDHRLLTEGKGGFAIFLAYCGIALHNVFARTKGRPRPVTEKCGLGNCVMLVGFDSNHVSWNARGEVSPDELTATDRAVHEEAEICTPLALRIAVVHHHPMTIPYADKRSLTNRERSLVFENGGTFLREMATHDFDLVLHGHKHYSHFSRINYQLNERQRIELGVLSAGSATIKNGNPKGVNSFNLITLYTLGRTRLEIVEYASGESEHNPRHAPAPFELHTNEAILERAFRRNSQAAPLWGELAETSQSVSLSGNCQGFHRLTGLRTKDHSLRRYELSLRTKVGRYSDWRLDEESERRGIRLAEDAAAAKARGFRDQLQGQKFAKALIQFTAPSGEIDDAPGFTLHWELVSGYAMNDAEYRLLYPPAERTTLQNEVATRPRESCSLDIIVPVSQMRISVDLPRGTAQYVFADVFGLAEYDPREILRNGVAGGKVYKIGRREGFLLRLAQKSIRLEHGAEHDRWILEMKNPPAGYRYELYWHFPSAALSMRPREFGGVERRADAMRRELSRRAREAILSDSAITLLQTMRDSFDRKFRAEIGIDEFDMSLMTFAESEHRLIALGGVFRSGKSGPEPNDFEPPPGVGLAGQCFKTGRVQFRQRSPVDKEMDPYFPMNREHEVLVSIPILVAAANQEQEETQWQRLSDVERSGLVIAILNLSSPNPSTGLTALSPHDASSAALIPQVQLVARMTLERLIKT